MPGRVCVTCLCFSSCLCLTFCTFERMGMIGEDNFFFYISHSVICAELLNETVAAISPYKFHELKHYSGSM